MDCRTWLVSWADNSIEPPPIEIYQLKQRERREEIFGVLFGFARPNFGLNCGRETVFRPRAVGIWERQSNIICMRTTLLCLYLLSKPQFMINHPIRLRRPLLTLLLCGVTFFATPTVFAAPVTDANLETMQNRREELTKAENALFDKISKGGKVPNSEILKLIDDWMKFDWTNSADREKSEKYAESQRAIQKFLPLAKDNSELQLALKQASALKQISANLFVSGGQPEQAIPIFKDYLADVAALKYDIDYRYQNSLLALGGAYMSTNDKKNADIILSQVAAYPWYSAPEPYFQDFRGLYGNSLRALISVRRFDKNALQRIYLPLAFQNELGPQLEAALKEAAGD